MLFAHTLIVGFCDPLLSSVLKRSWPALTELGGCGRYWKANEFLPELSVSGWLRIRSEGSLYWTAVDFSSYKHFHGLDLSNSSPLFHPFFVVTPLNDHWYLLHINKISSLRILQLTCLGTGHLSVHLLGHRQDRESVLKCYIYSLLIP